MSTVQRMDINQFQGIQEFLMALEKAFGSSADLVVLMRDGKILGTVISVAITNDILVRKAAEAIAENPSFFGKPQK